MAGRWLLALPALLMGAVSSSGAQGASTLVSHHDGVQRPIVGAGDSAIQAHQVRVLANNDEWTGTGLYLNQGDCVMIFTQEGKIRIGASLGEVDANGTSTGLGLLKGKIGTSAVFPIGQRTTFCNPDRGNLKLKVSDTRYEDNSGEFRVLVIRVPAQFIPTAEEYSSDE